MRPPLRIVVEPQSIGKRGEAMAEYEGWRIRVRGGIASGEVVLNSVTAGDRVVVSMVGDTVNIAARIEQLGRELFKASPDEESLHCLIDGATRSGFELVDSSGRPELEEELEPNGIEPTR